MSSEVISRDVREQGGSRRRSVVRDVIAPADMPPCCRSWLVEQVMIEARVKRGRDPIQVTPTGFSASRPVRSAPATAWKQDR